MATVTQIVVYVALGLLGGYFIFTEIRNRYFKGKKKSSLDEKINLIIQQTNITADDLNLFVKLDKERLYACFVEYSEVVKVEEEITHVSHFAIEKE